MGVERAAEQQRFAFARRQQTGQHFHGRGLAATVRADEAEYLAALDGEIDAIDGGEIAEAAGQFARDDDRLAVAEAPRRNVEPVVSGADFLRQQRDEGVFDARHAGLGLEFGRRTGCQNPSVIHRDQTVEPLGLFHVGGGDDDAHAGAARADAIDQFPELAARQRDRRRSSARRGSAGRDRG